MSLFKRTTKLSFLSCCLSVVVEERIGGPFHLEFAGIDLIRKSFAKKQKSHIVRARNRWKSCLNPITIFFKPENFFFGFTPPPSLYPELGQILYRYFQIADTFEYLLSTSRYQILLMEYLLSAGRQQILFDKVSFICLQIADTLDKVSQILSDTLQILLKSI